MEIILAIVGAAGTALGYWFTLKGKQEDTSQKETSAVKDMFEVQGKLVSNLSTEVSTLSLEVQRLNSDNKNLTIENEKLRREIQTLTTRIEELLFKTNGEAK